MDDSDEDCFIVDTVYNAEDFDDDDDDVQMVGVLVPPATTSKSKPEESSDSVTLHVEVNKSRATTTNESPIRFNNQVDSTYEDMTALASELTDWMNHRISPKLKTNQQELAQRIEDIPELVKSINDSLKLQTNPDNLEGVPSSSGLASTTNNYHIPFGDTYPRSVIPKPSTSATMAPTTSDSTNFYNLAGVPSSSGSTRNNYRLPVEDTYPLSVVPKPSTSTTVNPTTSDTTNSYNLAGVPSSSKVPATNDNNFPACLPVEDIYPRQSAPSTSSTRNPDNLEGVPGSSGMNQAFGTLSMQDQEKKPKKRKSKDKSSPKTPKKVKQKSNDDKSKPATPRAKQKLHKVATPPNVAPMSRQGGLQNVKNPNFGGVSATWTGSFTVPSIPATVFNPGNLWINGTLITPTNQPNIVWTNGNNPSQVTVQQTGNVTNINFTKRTTKARKSKSPRIPKMNIYSNPIDASTPFPKDHKPMVRTKLISVPEFIKPTEGIEPETIKLFLPETWSCHQDFELPGCKVVQLPKAHPEYLEVVEIIGRTLNRPIKNIHRIENPYLLTMFLLKKAELITRYGHCSEQLLFHGTNSANVYNIAVNNLDWRRYGKNVGHVYGCGVYFGSTAAVSNVYAKNSMFLVRVLIYWTEHGANDTSVPAIGIDTTTSTCGNITVKYDDFSYVPKYMVTFL